ncbi:MAG: MaoC family dehydratase N-terminal domain-containing protein, partial [Pseudomonadota bacterium]
MMELNSSLAGTKLPSLEREVTWRETMNYAAAIGDVNPRYMDDTSPAGIVAPPLFVVAVTWPSIEWIFGHLKATVSPDIADTMVHVGEHLIYHRLIYPGDRLKVDGRVIAVRPTSAGALLVSRLEVTDERGDPVAVEYNDLIALGVRCSDSGRSLEGLPVLPQWEGMAALWEVEISIPRRAAHLYDAGTGAFFAYHTSVAAARRSGFPDIILQGRAAMSLVAKEILEAEADGDPHRLREIACRFSGIIIPGTNIRLQV